MAETESLLETKPETGIQPAASACWYRHPEPYLFYSKVCSSSVLFNFHYKKTEKGVRMTSLPIADAENLTSFQHFITYAYSQNSETTSSVISTEVSFFSQYQIDLYSEMDFSSLRLRARSSAVCSVRLVRDQGRPWSKKILTDGEREEHEAAALQTLFGHRHWVT